MSLRKDCFDIDTSKCPDALEQNIKEKLTFLKDAQHVSSKSI